jgi:hypothetical protein
MPIKIEFRCRNVLLQASNFYDNTSFSPDDTQMNCLIVFQMPKESVTCVQKMISAPKTWEYTLGARGAYAYVRMDPTKAAILLNARWTTVSQLTNNLHKIKKKNRFVAFIFIQLDNYTAMKWRSVPLENNRGPFFAYH